MPVIRCLVLVEELPVDEDFVSQNLEVDLKLVALAPLVRYVQSPPHVRR